METHRVLHDFGELTHEDIEEMYPPNPPTSVQRKPYQFLIAALALGVLVGYFAKRKH